MDKITRRTRDFGQGTRKNDAGQLMRSVAQRLDDTDIAAVAGYFGSLELSTHGGQP